MMYHRIHQDIKPENLLVSKGPSGQDFDFSLKITDFGFCHTKIFEDGDDDTLGVDSHGGQTYGKLFPPTLKPNHIRVTDSYIRCT